MGRFEMRDQGRDCLIFCDVNFQGKCFNPHLLEAEMYRATKCVGGGGGGGGEMVELLKKYPVSQSAGSLARNHVN